jgi:N-acetylated-alpha-linked acidic dipeptidase
MHMKNTRLALLFALFVLSVFAFSQNPPAPQTLAAPDAIVGFRSVQPEFQLEQKFMAVPDPKLAEQHLKTLTAYPHLAGSPADKQTADYVAQKFREAGLDTQIVEYRVYFNYPAEISVDVVAPAGVKMHGPSPEHIDFNDPFQNEPGIVTAYNGLSPSGDVEADVIYANYGRPEDIAKLREMGIDPKGKILLVRYGANFRGVKSFVAQKAGAAGVIIYSDPSDDGWVKGDKYPKGPWRPDSGVQRGSIGYMFEFPGDPTTPGIASVASLPDSKRTPPEKSAAMPKIPTTPLSYKDAWPIMQNLGGPDSPREWQGALPFTYHIGPGPVRVKMHLKQDYAYRTIWDVIGRVRGSQLPDEWVVAGNHRDAWVYGAVDPNSGTAALLETVHGIGELLKSGWHPRRTLVFASWDAEEMGLMGSTEWGEEHESDLRNAVAYLNMDVGVAGPNFGSSSVPSLKQFVRDATKAVPSPKGGSVYDQWKSKSAAETSTPGVARKSAATTTKQDVPIGDLGSGSDYTVFLQHLGVPSTDIGSGGPFGVYHSTFDDFTWFKMFADPTFVYEQQMARVLGVEVLRMVDDDVLPYDYEEYGREIASYVDLTQKKADQKFGATAPSFAAADVAAKRLTAAGAALRDAQMHPPGDTTHLNRVLREAERAFLMPQGLPNRPWFRHAIYAPGEYTGYAAVALPGVSEAIDDNDLKRAEQQLADVTTALNRAAEILESYRP